MRSAGRATKPTSKTKLTAKRGSVAAHNGSQRTAQPAAAKSTAAKQIKPAKPVSKRVRAARKPSRHPGMTRR